ncbi:hypothetical protein BT69DRAFT_1337005 [Atractiella rhizophila]|nr:hypothetical protein BT69DRAFT_1337005 [Atractiella rhizophila]
MSQLDDRTSFPASYQIRQAPQGLNPGNIDIMYTPRKQYDGSCLLSFPAEPDTKFAIIDIREYYGKYVVAALEKVVDTVYPAPGWITPVEMASDFEKFSGRKVTFQKMPDEGGTVLLGVPATQL